MSRSGADSLNGGSYLEITLTLLSIISAAGIAVGFLTPVSAGLGACTSLVHWWSMTSDLDLSPSAAFSLIAGLVALAVALAGPGVMSIDARLFGRREIVIPPAKRDL